MLQNVIESFFIVLVTSSIYFVTNAFLKLLLTEVFFNSIIVIIRIQVLSCLLVFTFFILLLHSQVLIIRLLLYMLVYYFLLVQLPLFFISKEQGKNNIIVLVDRNLVALVKRYLVKRILNVNLEFISKVNSFVHYQTFQQHNQCSFYILDNQCSKCFFIISNNVLFFFSVCVVSTSNYVNLLYNFVYILAIIVFSNIAYLTIVIACIVAIIARILIVSCSTS